MASYTTNLNLKKPSGSEAVAIGDINGNMDTIDTAYGSLNGKIATIGNIRFVNFTTTGKNASDVGTVVDSALTDDCIFVGSINHGGKGTIIGYHYMSGSSHYFTAMVCWFGWKPVQYQGMAGTYTTNDQ